MLLALTSLGSLLGGHKAPVPQRSSAVTMVEEVLCPLLATPKQTAQQATVTIALG